MSIQMHDTRSIRRQLLSSNKGAQAWLPIANAAMVAYQQTDDVTFAPTRTIVDRGIIQNGTRLGETQEDDVSIRSDETKNAGIRVYLGVLCIRIEYKASQPT